MLIDIHQKAIYPAVIHINKGIIESIEQTDKLYDSFILPGFIDSHVHIESSMVTPGAFSIAAVRQGTIGVVSDPHEIANVLGIKGVEYMISDSKKVPLNFWFGAPSCVPATVFESSGASIDSSGIEKLMKKKEIKYLAEMMNFPGVIYNDEEVWRKIDVAKRMNKPIDGHAPGLTGEPLKKYIAAGISTDHECGTIAEAREKISQGMKVLIREGSAARNLHDLKDLFNSDPEMIMLCSDDLHPEMLATRHINYLVATLISEGYNMFDVIRACTLNPVLHYDLEAGLLKAGQPADFIRVGDYKKMNILETWIKGNKVFDNGEVLFDYLKGEAINNFNCSEINMDDVAVLRQGEKIRVIEAIDGELLTKDIICGTRAKRFIESDIESDILKIVVKDRYKNAPPVTGFIKGFGLKGGAFASSVAHDSHNIICIGTNDEDIVSAINEVVRLHGGLSISYKGKLDSIELNIAGIMSDRSCEEIASAYDSLSGKVKELGCPFRAPYMTLSFMALLVIPELKISDMGLFDVNKFKLVPLSAD